jgi:Flp pilus assembly protein TadD
MAEQQDPQLLFDNATEHLQNSRFDEAIGAFRAVIEIDPEIPEAHNNLGLCLFQKSQFDAAIEEYRAALELNADYALAHANLGLALLNKGNLDEAIDALSRATALDPDTAEAFYNLGIAFMKKGMTAEAISAYQSFIDKAPADYRNYVEGAEKIVAQLRLKASKQ